MKNKKSKNTKDRKFLKQSDNYLENYLNNKNYLEFKENIKYVKGE